MTPEALPLYRRLIVEGAWWDLVDEVATHLICDLVVGYPNEVWPAVDTWIDGDDMWLRRSAIICQVGQRSAPMPSGCSDSARNGVSRRSSSSERRSAGPSVSTPASIPMPWPRFVMAHRDGLSGLSYREATRHIGHLLRS